MHVLHGSLLLVSMFFGLVCYGAAAEYALEVKSADGASLSTVGSGIPFQIIVSMRNCSDQPQVELDDAPFALLRRVSIQTRVINGNSTISYVYSARIDRVGTYEIGPAHILVGGVRHATNTCTIVVGTHQKVVGARYVVDLSTDDESLYLGQETMVRIRVYSAVGTPEIEAIHIPKMSGVEIGEMKPVGTGSEHKDGVNYRYKEYAAPLYATMVGTIKLPSCSVDIYDEQNRRSGFFFFSIAPTRQIHSNTLDLLVHKIPQGSKPYALVGDYTDTEVSVDPALVTVGQAICYRITIFGKGNNQLAKPPLLGDIPPSCKYYDSAATPLARNEGIVFEYIIQPKQPGTWEIPSQEIVYFSPKAQKLCTLSTDAVVITAHGTAAQDVPTVAAAASSAVQPNTTPFRYHPDLLSEDPIPYKNSAIPWHWYWIVCMCTISIGILFFLIKRYYAYYHAHRLYYRKMQAYRRARSALHVLERTGKGSLYMIFVDFFAALWMIDPSSVTESYIAQHLITSGLLSSDGIQSWHRFWHTVVQDQYGSIKKQQINKTVYTEARLWIGAFSKMAIR